MSFVPLVTDTPPDRGFGDLDLSRIDQQRSFGPTPTVEFAPQLRPRPPGTSSFGPQQPTGSFTPGGGRVGAPGAPTTGGQAGGLSQGETAAMAIIQSILASYGILHIRDSQGRTLADLARAWVTQGITDATVLRALVEQSEQFNIRFPAIAERRRQGLPPISGTDYVQFEAFAGQLFQEFGLPPQFYDEVTDFTELIATARDLGQARQSLQRRVQAGFAAVAAAPPEVRDAFATFFGPRGDAALAAWFLDPDRALPALEAQVTASMIGGEATRFELDLDRERALRLQSLGVDRAAAAQGFARIRDLDPVFRETASERVDLTPSGEGIGAVFRLDDRALDLIERRVEQRRSAFAGGGGFQRGRAGSLIGLGTGR